MEGDGHTREPVTMRVRLVVDGDRAIVDWTGSDPQARGPVNATYGVTVSATCNAFLQVSGAEIPRNAGAYGCITTIAPPGSVVNVRFPGPSVGGNTETQPKLVGMLLGALAEAMPERVMAAEGATACNFLFGGIHPDDRRAVRPLPLRGERLGRPRRRRRAERPEPRPRQLPQHAGRGVRDALPVPHPLVRADARTRAGRAATAAGWRCAATSRCWRRRSPRARCSTASSAAPGASSAAGPGRCAALLVRRAGDDRFRDFCEAFGTVEPVEARRASCCARATSSGSRAPAAAGSATRSSAIRQLVLRDVRDGLVGRGATPSATTAWCSRRAASPRTTGRLRRCSALRGVNGRVRGVDPSATGDHRSAAGGLCRRAPSPGPHGRRERAALHGGPSRVAGDRLPAGVDDRCFWSRGSRGPRPAPRAFWRFRSRLRTRPSRRSGALR